MLFRPLELVWNDTQKGFSLMSFSFPDDSYYSMFALIRLSKVDGWWFSIVFNGWIIGPEGIEDELDED